MAVIIEDKNMREQQGASSFPGRKICVTPITELKSCFKISHLPLFQGKKKPRRWIHAAALYNICLSAFIHFHSVKIQMNCIFPHLSETLWATYLTIGKTPLVVNTKLYLQLWWYAHLSSVCVMVGVYSCLSPFAFCIVQGHNNQHVTTQVLLPSFMHIQPSRFLICFTDVSVYMCRGLCWGFIWRKGNLCWERCTSAYRKRRKTKLQDEFDGQKEAAETE